MIRLLFIFTLIVSSCAHQQSPPLKNSRATTNTQTAQAPATPANPIPLPPATKTIPTPKSPQAKAPLAYHHTSRSGIILSLVSFDDRDFQLQVADQSHGPATHWNNSREAAHALGGVAAINGGFFTPQGKPLGLVITDGQRRGRLSYTSLGSGIFLTTQSQSNSQSAIVRRQIYSQSPQRWGTISHLLQTGPMLTENSDPISGLSKNNHRPRSFIAWDGNHHWAIGYAESCTLDALSRAISGRAPAGFAIKTAVNLDGGRSSDLWVGSQVSGGNKTHRGFLNKPVRNFLVVVPK